MAQISFIYVLSILKVDKITTLQEAREAFQKIKGFKKLYQIADDELLVFINQFIYRVRVINKKMDLKQEIEEFESMQSEAEQKYYYLKNIVFDSASKPEEIFEDE